MIACSVVLSLCLQTTYPVLAPIVATTKMESPTVYSDNLAIENFREYLRIKTVQPKPDYGNICNLFFQVILTFFNHCFDAAHWTTKR